jgi:GxxExxY protein
MRDMDLNEQKKPIYNAQKYPHKELTEKIIRVFYCVYNELGYGFLENVYLNAMSIELRLAGFCAELQPSIDVYYKKEIAGKYRADLIVNNLIIIELKATECLMPEHERQLMNYLRSTDKEVGLLLNFGMQPEIRRRLFTNDRKRNLRQSY